jgi:Winged helix-turn helix
MILDGIHGSMPRARQAWTGKTLRDWVHRYNEAASAAWCHAKHLGRPQTDPGADDGTTRAGDRWAGLEGPQIHQIHPLTLRRSARGSSQALLGRRTGTQIGKWLHKLKLTQLQPRPHQSKMDAAAQEAFNKTSVHA